jgi:hypothetical protein
MMQGRIVFRDAFPARIEIGTTRGIFGAVRALYRYPQDDGRPRADYPVSLQRLCQIVKLSN